MVASFTCRNSGKRLGTLFITAKHVSFADASMLVPDNRRIFILPLERLRQVNLVGFDSISLVTNHSNPEQFSRFTNRDAVLQAIYNQVRNTGTFLEMYMAPIWGQVVGESVGADATSLKRFKCSRQGLISKHQGSLIISAACLIFEPEKKKKVCLVLCKAIYSFGLHVNRLPYVVALINGMYSKLMLCGCIAWNQRCDYCVWDFREFFSNMELFPKFMLREKA